MNPLKSGWVTTEAWLTGLVSYLTADVVMSDNAPYVKMVALAAGALVAVTYVWSRAHIKAKHGGFVDETEETTK